MSTQTDKMRYFQAFNCVEEKKNGGVIWSLGRRNEGTGESVNESRGDFRNQQTLPQALVESGRCPRCLTREVGAPYERFKTGLMTLEEGGLVL